jgi:hypothetical protein
MTSYLGLTCQVSDFSVKQMAVQFLANYAKTGEKAVERQVHNTSVTKYLASRNECVKMRC